MPMTRNIWETPLNNVDRITCTERKKEMFRYMTSCSIVLMLSFRKIWFNPWKNSHSYQKKNAIHSIIIYDRYCRMRHLDPTILLLFLNFNCYYDSYYFTSLYWCYYVQFCMLVLLTRANFLCLFVFAEYISIN